MINSPFHKHIFYAVHLRQSSVGHQLTQELGKGKGLLIKNPIVPFQWKTLSAGEHRMEECEKRPLKRVLYVLCSALLTLALFFAAADIFFQI